METPWGPSQQVETIAPGIVSVSTAGHGGLKLSAERWARVAQLFPNQGKYAPDGWLEEDCDWALAALAWPELFPIRDCYFAVRTFSNAGEYGETTRAWLETPAAAAVKTRAALWTPADEEKHKAECQRRYAEMYA